VDRVDVPAEVSGSERVFLLKVTARPGDVIKRPPDGNTIDGFLGTTGSSEQDALALKEEYASKIEVSFR
ncbi:carboxylate--amine ligase, partial [Saccharothrix sp. MB29]|nr:carboxylate--amine ligase [Saccharothrix sp. MB29]